jgi:hypothetical protein
MGVCLDKPHFKDWSGPVHPTTSLAYFGRDMASKLHRWFMYPGTRQSLPGLHIRVRSAKPRTRNCLPTAPSVGSNWFLPRTLLARFIVYFRFGRWSSSRWIQVRDRLLRRRYRQHLSYRRTTRTEAVMHVCGSLVLLLRQRTQVAMCDKNCFDLSAQTANSAFALTVMPICMGLCITAQVAYDDYSRLNRIRS